MNDQTAIIYHALSIIVPPGAVEEMRILNAGRLGTVSGYYNDLWKLAKDAAGWSGKVDGVYITINPVNKSLLARANNRFIQYAKHTTKDEHIERRCYLPIDADAVRPAGISSTDEQHEEALRRIITIQEFLRSKGWPNPIQADSGNGGHLLFPIDLPNTKEVTDLLKRCLAALAFRFDDEHVIVDPSTYNASRIWKLYGTLAAKGDEIPGIPHRYAKLLNVPDTTEIVSLELLEQLAATLPNEPKHEKGIKASGTSFDLDQWIQEHGLNVISTGPWKDGRKWLLQTCAWNGHTDRAAYIVQFSNGGIAAGCQHDSCKGYSWHDLRDAVEPGWRDRRKKNHSQDHSAYQDGKQEFDDPNNDEELNEDDKNIEGFYPSLNDLLSADLPEPEEILCGLHRGEVAGLVAVTNYGKSTLLFNTSLAIAAGEICLPLTPIASKPRRILYIDCESPAPTLQADIRTMLHNISNTELACENFIVVVDATILDQPLNLGRRDHFNIVLALAKLYSVDLVIIDTAASAFELQDENSNAEVTRRVMSPLKKLAREANCAVIFTHHIGKSNETQMGEGSYRGRGASAFGALSRAIYTLEKEATKGEGYVVLSCPKSKGNSFQPTLLKLDQERRWFFICAEKPEQKPGPLTAQEIADYVASGEANTTKICEHFKNRAAERTIKGRISETERLNLIEKPSRNAPWRLCKAQDDVLSELWPSADFSADTGFVQSASPIEDAQMHQSPINGNGKGHSSKVKGVCSTCQQSYTDSSPEPGICAYCWTRYATNQEVDNE